MPPLNATGDGVETPHAELHRTPSKEQDRAELFAIDSAIERMRKLTPTDPYVLTIPQDDELRYHYHWQFQTRQWLDHTPFTDREHDSIQYQTFIFHDPAHEMYMQHSLRPKEHTNGTANGGAKTAAGMQQAAPKKTMSFNTYKKKQAGELTAAEEKALKEERREIPKDGVSSTQIKPESPAEAARSQKETSASTAREVKRSDIESKVDQKGTIELKRKREEDDIKPEKVDIKREQNTRSPSRTHDEDRAIKKFKKSPSPAAHVPKAVKHVQNKDEANSKDMRNGSSIARGSTSKPVNGTKPSLTETKKHDAAMPPRLSPLLEGKEKVGLPPRLSPSLEPRGRMFLPERLSPTLPDNIMQSLRAAKHNRSTSASSNTQLAVPVDDRHAQNPLKRKSPTPRNGFRASSSSPAARSEGEGRERKVAVKQPSSQAAALKAPAKHVQHLAAESDNRSSTERERQSLVVKLKCPSLAKAKPIAQTGTKRRSPSPAPRQAAKKEPDKPLTKSSTAKAPADQSEANIKGVARKVKPQEPTKPPEKRVRPADQDDPDPAAKRRKPAVDAADRDKRQAPSTPTRSRIASPGADNSAHKHATPDLRKEALPAAMRREISIHTPSGRVSPSTTNGSTSVPPQKEPSKPNAPASAAALPTSKMTPLQHAWDNKRIELEKLGRELKHASQDHRDKRSTSIDSIRAAITALESLMCFMLAFSASDESARAADPPIAPPYKTWRTLLSFQSFVRAGCEAIPLLRGLASALGIASHARLIEILTHSRNLSERETPHLIEACAHLHRMALEADAKLDVDTLMEKFPRTWARRSTKPSPSSVEKVDLGTWKGEYKLPIGVQTTPVRAVRAAHALLEEWIAVEQVEYKLRLKL